MTRKILMIIIYICFFISFSIISFSSNLEDLKKIEEEEKIILGQYLELHTKYEILKNQVEQLIKEIDLNEISLKEVELNLEINQKKYDSDLIKIEKIYKSYQKRGNSSYFEILFESKSIVEFIENLSTISEYSKNINKIIEKHKENIVLKKIELDEIENLKNKNKITLEILNNNLIQLENALKEKELFLDNIKTLKESYYDKVNKLINDYNISKERMMYFSKSMTEVFSNGENINNYFISEISFLEIRTIIKESDFESIIEKFNEFDDYEVKFDKDLLTINDKRTKASIKGNFYVKDNYFIEFIPTNISIDNIYLDENSMKEFLENEILLLDLKELTGGRKIKEVRIFDEQMIFYLTLF